MMARPWGRQISLHTGGSVSWLSHHKNQRCLLKPDNLRPSLGTEPALRLTESGRRGWGVGGGVPQTLLHPQYGQHRWL